MQSLFLPSYSSAGCSIINCSETCVWYGMYVATTHKYNHYPTTGRNLLVPQSITYIARISNASRHLIQYCTRLGSGNETTCRARCARNPGIGLSPKKWRSTSQVKDAEERTS